MPENRRAVWVPRLDHDETIKRCPLIKNNPELSKALDELLAAHDKSRSKTNQEKDGGENANEQTKSEK
jgi:hypothetical protein